MLSTKTTAKGSLRNMLVYLRMSRGVEGKGGEETLPEVILYERSLAVLCGPGQRQGSLCPGGGRWEGALTAAVEISHDGSCEPAGAKQDPLHQYLFTLSLC